jgi:Zn-finger nucleic acid-binding protein
MEDGRGQQLSCPSCQLGMTTLRFGRMELDRCTAHGYWFDRDELEQVLYAVFELDQRSRGA